MSFIKKTILSSLTICICALLFSCGGMKPGGGKSGKSLYETFYVGEEGIQYFIKPLAFKDDDSELLLDITFRHKDRVQDSATLNFSIRGSELIKQIDTLILSNSQLSSSITASNIEYLFAERTKRGYTSRFSTKLDLIHLEKLFENSDWTLNTDSKEILRKRYISTSSTKKNIEKLNQNIFFLF
jgi:hypothetical protein